MATSTCAVAVNGAVIGAAAEQPLIAVLRDAGIDLPAVCYHPSLGP